MFLLAAQLTQALIFTFIHAVHLVVHIFVHRVFYLILFCWSFPEANKTKLELDKVSELLTELSNDSKALQGELADIKSNISGVCNKALQNCSGFNASDYNTDADFSSVSC